MEKCLDLTGMETTTHLEIAKKTETCKSAEDLKRGGSKKENLRAGLEPLEHSMVPSED